MNTRAFGLAIIFAAIAMLLASTYIDENKKELLKKYGDDVSVVIAKTDINELDLIDDSKVMVITVPKKFKSDKAFDAIKDVENTVATVPILKGEQITPPRVTFPGARTGLSRQVQAGKRAVAITITDQQAVSKLIKPGDRVDVLAGIDFAQGRRDKQKVKTILQDVVVLSTGMSMSGNIPMVGVESGSVVRKMNLNTYTEYNTVTLELTPAEAQKVVYLLTYANARPFLVLRNNSDRTRLNDDQLKATRIYDMLGEETEEARQYFEERYQDSGRRPKQ